MIVEGITISEMAEKLGIPKHTVETRLNRVGIEPIFYGSLYSPDTLDKIRAVKRGRPAKKPEAPDEDATPAKK
jgi:predicted ArsR family transcriptional regulator